MVKAMPNPFYLYLEKKFNLTELYNQFKKSEKKQRF